MQLTEHQTDIVEKIIFQILINIEAGDPIHKFVELNGAAGVGKTFSTIEIVKRLKELKKTIAFAAPTHAAISVIKKINKEAGSKMFLGTIHSFLNLTIENDLDTGEQILQFGEEFKNSCDVLIIDEKSMLCKEILDKIYASIRAKKVKSVLLIGDGFQLPCVNGKVMKPFPHYFELTEIVRQQAGNPIIGLSGIVRESIANNNFGLIEDVISQAHKEIKIFDNEQAFLKHFYNVSKNENEKIIGAYENSVVNSYNKMIFNTLNPNSEYVKPGVSFILQHTNNTFEKGKWEHTHNNGEKVYIDKVFKTKLGDIRETDKLEDMLLFDEINDYEKQILKTFKQLEEIRNFNIDNLSYFYCKDITNRTLVILDERNEKLLEQILYELKETALDTPDTKYRRYLFTLFFNLRKLFANVKYSYANTFHKLQGSTFKHVGIDIRSIEYNKGKDLEYQDQLFRLLYVGITRASDTLFILKNKSIVSEGGYIDF